MQSPKGVEAVVMQKLFSLIKYVDFIEKREIINEG